MSLNNCKSSQHDSHLQLYLPWFYEQKNLLQYDRFQQEGAMTNKNALKDMKAAILLACQQTQQVLEKDNSPLPFSGVHLKL